jgi:hypothetical protein
MRIPKTPPLSLVPARNWHFQFIAEHMREDERQAWLALSGATKYDADAAATSCMNAPGIHFALLGNGFEPIVAGGFSRLRGLTYEAWMIGTPAGWSEGWRGITRAVRWAIREQFRAGAQRIQVVTLESRINACAWYERALHMHKESVLSRAGAHGEDLVMYATFKEAWL